MTIIDNKDGYFKVGKTTYILAEYKYKKPHSAYQAAMRLLGCGEAEGTRTLNLRIDSPTL